ncbi:unnamed protein product [Alternaria alternata]|uniref:BTB domain-containing protein n=1 Tax=Alternaria tenuissima TaxID=119927 RepID=A0ABY0FYF6_9PLEO|nr:hypothetical protein B0T12DRAFT_478932 [Alternaria alternata]RYN90532.1 hypothetical protein AA0120_g5830 [Alternaria tenuissima]RYN90961.1 hypothetical protein AA0119_g10911 [Alternaria tenuissima]RYO22191.1 hypothetical protein AA0121_g2823 [Alternaria tenuissima]
MATGLKNPAAPEECAHGEKLVGSAKNGGVGIIRFKSLHGFATLKQWSIHKELMESECDGLKWQAGDCCTYDLRPEFPLQVFDLFIRWLYTRKYQEKEGLAWSFDTCLTLLSAPLEIDVAPRLRVDWPVKAAIASWELGATLHAKNFQNYAIKRLFEAFSRPLSQPLAPALLAYVFQLHKESFAEGSSQLQQLVQDVFVRNWGDVTIIDHTDQGLWSFFVGLCPSFREDFLAATKHALEKRQEKELDLANHH